jgi:hypothetical protein
MHLRGDIVSGGQVLLAGVSVTIQRYAGTGLPAAWSGFFVLPPGHSIAAGRYPLALSDGRAVDIAVRHVGGGLRRTRFAYFDVVSGFP